MRKLLIFLLLYFTHKVILSQDGKFCFPDSLLNYPSYDNMYKFDNVQLSIEIYKSDFVLCSRFNELYQLAKDSLNDANQNEIIIGKLIIFGELYTTYYYFIDNFTGNIICLNEEFISIMNYSYEVNLIKDIISEELVFKRYQYTQLTINKNNQILVKMKWQ